MSVRYIIGEIATGRRIVNLPAVSGSWANDLDTPDSLSAVLKLNNAVALGLDLANAATTPKNYLAAIDTGPFGEDRAVLASGPIWATSYNRPNQTVQLTAKGFETLFDHRNVLPLAALTLPVTDWTIPDPADPSGVGTIPNPAVATAYTGLSYGGIAVSLVAQALAWPGASLPLVLPAIETGTREKRYEGAAFKKLGQALTDLTNIENGVEMRFSGRFTSDGLGLEWVMEVGTAAKPLLYSDTVQTWNVTAKESPVADLTVERNGSDVAGISWAVGGRADDTVLLSRALNPALTANGFPLMETLDSSHADVVLQPTLDAYAVANLATSAAPVETWTFSVKAHPLDRGRNVAGPQLENYKVGDFIRLHIDPYDTATDKGDLYFPQGGDFPLRIVGLSGNQEGEDVTIKCAPQVL